MCVYIYICSFLILLHYKLLQYIELSSSCYTVGRCCVCTISNPEMLNTHPKPTLSSHTKPLLIRKGICRIEQTKYSIKFTFLRLGEVTQSNRLPLVLLNQKAVYSHCKSTGA